MLSTRSFPRAIVHFDADSFFASVEQSLDHTLRGKVVVTGGERGAATSVSIEGKKVGLYRGMTLKEMKRLCPEVIIVPGDYTAYSIYARRMYSIVREFTSDVEEYSIDECFADITGLRAKYHMPYEGIALMIKERLQADLGITFGVGLGPNKTLAKIASKINKPDGFASIPAKNAHTILAYVPIGTVWGLGYATSLRFEKLGIKTAFDFAEKEEWWLKLHAVSKPYRDIWLEMHGHYVRPLSKSVHDSIGSILHSRTFKPTSDKQTLISALAHNIEGVCIKARSHSVKGKTCRFYLKTQEFTYAGKNLSMSIPLNDPREFMRLVEMHFNSVYEVGTIYRATGFGLYSITPDTAMTPDLFGESARVASTSSIFVAIDALNKKYGRNTIHLGASHAAHKREHVLKKERDTRGRQKPRLDIDHRKKSFNIPYLGTVH